MRTDFAIAVLLLAGADWPAVQTPWPVVAEWPAIPPTKPVKPKAKPKAKPQPKEPTGHWEQRGLFGRQRVWVTDEETAPAARAPGDCKT
jgi:hypothetical protein